MLKHVQISPLRNRADSLSIRSTTSCASSLCGSPEPPSSHECTRTPSRASSYSSLSETLPQTTIKIYTACLKVDIEYKTLGITWDTTSREVIASVLRRCKQRHRDPRLFYLSMEVTVRRAGIRTVLMLDDETRPAVLQTCHPKGDSRFCLQLKPGGLVRVHTSALQPTSQYKSLVISEETTSDELLSILLSCYNSAEPVEQFSLYEVCPGQEYQRKLHPDDLPLRAQVQRRQRGEISHFLVRRNPNYPRRRTLLPPICEKSISNSTTSIVDSLTDDFKLNLNLSNPCNNDSNNNNSNNNEAICRKCRNNFKTCDFCNKITPNNQDIVVTPTYNPVYNLREIRTVCHTFSAFGIDKKLIEVEQNNNSSNNNNNNNVICKNYIGNRHSYCNSSSGSSSSSTSSNDSGSSITYTPITLNRHNTDETVLCPNAIRKYGNFQYV